MSWLSKIASVELYYHGTGGQNLSTILSQGLNSNHPKAWGEDTESDHSRVSFSGTYFTKNFMTAESSAGFSNTKGKRKHGDSRVIVIAQLENRTPSIVLDEDLLPDVRHAYQLATGYIMNDWSALSWAHAGFDGVDAMADKYLEQIKYRYPNINQKLLDALHPYVPNVIRAYVLREVAIAFKHDAGKWKYEFPEFANFTLPEKEAEYRIAVDTFIQKAHRFTSLETPRYSENVRVTEPITFSGKNKIVLVAFLEEKYPSSDYYVKATIMYGNDPRAIAMLQKDMYSALSQNMLIKDKSGKVYYDNPKTPEPELATV